MKIPDKELKLSIEAMGALMMCLQKCLLEQSDITEILKNLKFKTLDDELYVMNPPIVKFENDDSEELNA
tara:strand:+ start:177 stop:383 length:207 start_codon:yes stop_codon:yes gene_type:complete